MPAAMGVFYLFFFLLESKERVRKSRGKQVISVRATEVLLYFEICPCLSAFQDCLQV